MLAIEMRNSAKVLLIPCLFAAWFCGSASAGTVDIYNGQDLTPLVDAIEDLPPADIVGWLTTFDPSNQWTSADNIATMKLWLDVVEEIGADPSLLSTFSGFGEDSAETAAVYQWVAADMPAGTHSDTAPDSTPEPATLGLLGGALVMFALSSYVSLRRSD
jgi:PEP-CTERM motif